MDPFTEKLLERTRARRENLQKKMAERPKAANRQMVKRCREPLSDTNSVISEPVIDKVPQVSTKPSPSKRRCSEENTAPAAREENWEPMAPTQLSTLLDPPTDKKPPVGPASLRTSSSMEKTSARPAVHSQTGELKTAHPELEKMAVTPTANRPCSSEAQVEPGSSALLSSSQNQVEDPAPSSAAGMRSRLQRLAAQRKCWDGDDTSDTVPDHTPLSLLRAQANVPPAPTPSTSTGTPLGRKGRLANLAATIGSWEDDLSHANIPKEKPIPASDPRFAVRDAPNDKRSAAETSWSMSTSDQVVYPSVKSTRVVANAQKTDILASKPPPESGTSPHKSSVQDTLSSNSLNARSSSSASVSQSPQKNQALSRNLNVTSSPQKPELCSKPTMSCQSGPQEKVTAGAPGVKSFLERFGERCQEHSNESTPVRVASQARTPAVTLSATPNTRLVQERLRAAQAASTTTADLAQRQKMERESELALIRSRVQKGNNMWKNKGEGADAKTCTDSKEHADKPAESDVSSCDSTQEPPALVKQGADAPGPLGSHGLMLSPPVSTSSPLKMVANTAEKVSDETPEEEVEKEEEEKVQDVAKETEMNRDQSINSVVINKLFDGVLEQSEEEEEEDALNISSMSLLTPLAETVAAVVQSPERRMMTSFPANSFIMKSNTPDNVFKPSKFQRTNVKRSASSDSIDEDHKLPYSIDAYRSTRVKDTDRPNVKQVIVRKEDVSQRAEEPRGSNLFSIKQRMKILTNEINLQQTVIHQASQALNCCTDEEHGKGSQVEAEAERLLLVATEKREALKAELDRLKGDPAGQKRAPAATEPAGVSASKGSITLQEFRLPLKADFVCSTANKPESTKHSFFIMICAGAENTVATPLASTHRGLSGDTLTFPTKFHVSDVSSDFGINIEVYCLAQKRDICTEKKKKPNKSKAITPKRFLTITKSAQTPVVSSPGGPNAVRTSNFVLVGTHKLTLSSIGKNKFVLEKVPFLCALEGHVYLKMQCEVGSKVEERGFLTMFEDVSGFGAWHRRWCVLSGHCISYWTYPDDEKRKNPIGCINLTNCMSKMVEPANREFCARPNTLELITVRPQREDDKETLVSQCQNTMCVTKNWLSADTKDERDLWMKKLNQILVDLRMWQPEACYRPL
ncbi:anillin [Pholidichthys leucotaenia]